MTTTSASAQPLVVAGCYAPAGQPGIHLFRFNDATGALAACGFHAGIANPSFLVTHPNRRWLYTVSETGQEDTPGSLWALRFTGEPLTLQPINRRLSGGDSPCHLQLDRSGKWLLVSNYGAGTVAVLPILGDGSLAEMTDLVQHDGRSVHSQRQDRPHAHSAAFAPDNRFAVVADLGLDQLLVYAFDSSAGKLSARRHADTRPGSGPRHMAFHPGGRRLYVANELDNTVTVYDYDTSSGVLRPQQTADTLPPGVLENAVADIHVAPSGRRLYVSNRGHNSIAVFDVATDGRLARSAIVPCGGKWPRHFTLAPGGRFMLVANQASGELSVLPLLAGPEAIGAPVAGAAAAQVSCVQFVTAHD